VSRKCQGPPQICRNRLSFLSYPELRTIHSPCVCVPARRSRAERRKGSNGGAGGQAPAAQGAQPLRRPPAAAVARSPPRRRAVARSAQGDKSINPVPVSLLCGSTPFSPAPGSGFATVAAPGGCWLGFSAYGQKWKWGWGFCARVDFF
jgi:hypothetical protein